MNDSTRKKELLEKITRKREFSRLPLGIVEKAFSRFEKDCYSDKEKVKLTRDFLRRVFSVFASNNLLKKRKYDWKTILRKHSSTRERLPYFGEIYSRVLKGFEDSDKICIFDLGCGVNGFSYSFFPRRVKYIGIEAIGQLVDLANAYFKKEGIPGEVFQMDLFDFEQIGKVISRYGGKRVVLLLKVLDSLEMFERGYSKILLSSLKDVVDRIVVSFATKSLIRGERFKVTRRWFIDFVKKDFDVLDKFEFGGEKYFVLCPKG